MALIQFLAGENHLVNDLSGSGLGFYGFGGYGTSVEVGQYQDNTYITNATGTATDAVKCDNVKWVDNASGGIAGGVISNLLNIPNYLSTLNIRFTNGTACKTQNAQLRIFDRSNIDNPAVDVVTKVAVLVHPWDTSTPAGSGSPTWYTPGGSASIVNFSDMPCAISPGSGGWSSLGANTSDIQHDWFVAVSATPITIGSKVQYALFFSCEFL